MSLLVLASVALTGISDARAGDYAPRGGDVLLQTSRSNQSLAIQLATGSRYSHAGLLIFRHGAPYVFEAIGPVVLTPLDAWIARGEGGQFTALRLADEAQLTPEALNRMAEVSRRFAGLPYDWTFGWGDDQIYCSELVWKIYDEGLAVRLIDPQRVGDFDLSHPAVQAKLRERYGDAVPLDEPAVAPGQFIESELLVEVYSSY